MHEFVAAKQLAANDVEAVPAKADFARASIRRGPTLQDVADTENQLSWLEGLCKIIIGALLQSIDAVLGLGHRTQQQNRDPALAAQRARQLQPVLSRHHHIEDHQIEGEARQMRSGFACITSDRNPEPSIREIPPQKLSEPRVVIHDQQMRFRKIGLTTTHYAAIIGWSRRHRLTGEVRSNRRLSSSSAMIPSNTLRKPSTARAPAWR